MHAPKRLETPSRRLAGHDPLHELLRIAAIAHTDAVVHERQICMQFPSSCTTFASAGVIAHEHCKPACSTTAGAWKIQLTKANVRVQTGIALHQDCDAGIGAHSAANMETVVRIKQVLHRMIDLILEHWYTPNKVSAAPHPLPIVTRTTSHYDRVHVMPTFNTMTIPCFAN